MTAIFHTVPLAYLCYLATYNCVMKPHNETVYYTYNYNTYYTVCCARPVFIGTDLPDNAVDGKDGTLRRGIMLRLDDQSEFYVKRPRLWTDFACWDWVVGNLAISTFILTPLVVVLAATVRVRRFNINTYCKNIVLVYQ